MKNLLKFILSLAVIGFLAACSSSDDFETDNLDALKHHEGKMVTLGFNLVFDGEYLSIGADSENCPGLGKVTHQGAGTGTHFKKLTTYFEFCVDTDGSYPHGYMVGEFTDEDGDELYVMIPDGHVIQGRVPGMPSYATSYFKDEFLITGGTGKFAEASGSGYTNDYNYSVEEVDYLFPSRTKHHWQGTITMKKGK